MIIFPFHTVLKIKTVVQYTVATHNLELYYNCISYDFNRHSVINSRYGKLAFFDKAAKNC